MSKNSANPGERGKDNSNYQKNSLDYSASTNLQLSTYSRRWLTTFVENAKGYSSTKRFTNSSKNYASKENSTMNISMVIFQLEFI